MHLSKYEDLLAEHCKKALSAMESDPASLPVPCKVEYRHLPSLIENAKSYTTNPKYAEWQSGIINSLPHLEDSLSKLKSLEIPAAEKDIIDAVRIAVNTPFMQVIKCKERQRELQMQLQKTDESYAETLVKSYAEFQQAHKERKVHQALELVAKLENSIHDATNNFQARLDTFGEAKKLMNAAFDPIDPLNMHDYEPPHEQAVAALRAKAKEVTETRNRWTADLQQLKAVGDDASPESTLGALKKQAQRSSLEHKKAVEELDSSNAQVKACWDALMEAQRRASDAEKDFIASKLKEEVDHQLVKDVCEQVEKHQQILEESILSSDKYCDVLKSVEKYIHGRWDPWREVVKNETKKLVTEVCEVYSISEKSLGDVIDRKMSQVSPWSGSQRPCHPLSTLDLTNLVRL